MACRDRTRFLLTQQIEFLRCRIQQMVPYPRLERVRIEADLVELHDVRATQVLSSVNGPDTRMQFCEMKRFGDIVVGSFFETDDLVVDRIPRGDDQHIAVFVLGADLVQQPDPIPIWQPDVQQDTIVFEKPQLFPRLVYRPAGLANIALPSEKIPDIPRQFLVVLDYEHLHPAKSRTKFSFS